MDKIILVHYIGIGDFSKSRSSKDLLKYLDFIDQEPDIINYIIPVKNEINSRIECINPKLVSEVEFNSAKEVLDESQKALIAFLRSEKVGL